MTTDEAGEDSREGPGWADYLQGAREPFEGRNGLPLGEKQHLRARRVWHQALTWYMSTYGGDSVNTLAGNMGWFELRLTFQETDDLFESAAGDPKDPIVKSPRQPENADRASTVWKTTQPWARRGRPRGASGRDMLARVPTAFTTTASKYFAAATAIAAVGSIAGVKVAAGSPEAWLMAAVVVWVGLVGLAVVCLRDQGDLTAAALAWDRMRAYRPARWKFEQQPLRAAAPHALIAVATIGLAVMVFWTFKARHKLTDVPWRTAWIAAAALMTVTVAGYWLGRRRSKRLWAPVAEEQSRRRPKFR